MLLKRDIGGQINVLYITHVSGRDFGPDSSGEGMGGTSVGGRRRVSERSRKAPRGETGKLIFLVTVEEQIMKMTMLRMVAAAVGLMFACAGTVYAQQATCPDTDGAWVYDGEGGWTLSEVETHTNLLASQKYDFPEDTDFKTYDICAPDGYLITGYCVKAGTNVENDVFDPSQECVTLFGVDNKGISHFTLEFEEIPLDECWKGETAWAAGTRYTARGNWATYTTFADGLEVILYAGQTYEAGTVTFVSDGFGGVDITITLNDGFRFEMDETYTNVYVQDYAVAPSGNPASGLFDHKAFADSSPFTIKVPLNNFYGVHVNVERVVECVLE
jgi:hypothetical protein